MNLNSFAQKGQQFIKEGKFQEAEIEYNQAIQEDPNNFMYYASRAGIYNCTRQFEKAIADTQKSIQLNPNFSKSYIQQGYAYFNLKQHKNAVESYNLALKLEPDNNQIKQFIKKAESQIEEPVANDAQILQYALNKLASSQEYTPYLANGKLINKLEIFTKSPQLKDQLIKDDQIFEKIIKFAFEDDGKNGQEGEIKKQEEECINNEESQFNKMKYKYRDPGDQIEQLYKCWNKKAPKEESKKQEEGQGEDKKQVSQQNKEQEKVNYEAISESYKIQGNDHYENKNYEVALQLYDKALLHNSKEVLLYSNKAACYIQMEKLEDALQQIETAIKEAEKFQITDQYKLARIWTRKGAIMDKLGRLEEAIASYEKSQMYVKNEKTEQEIQYMKLKINEKEVSAKLQKAQELFKSQQYQDGLQYVDELSKSYPNSSQLYVIKSNFEIKLKRLKDGIQSLDKALQIDKKNVRAWAKKGHLHCILEDYTMAQACFELGQEVAPNDQECLKGIQKCESLLKNQKNPQLKELQIRIQQAMKQDQQLNEILSDPEILNILEFININPDKKQEVLSNPIIKDKLEILQKAGFLVQDV